MPVCHMPASHRGMTLIEMLVVLTLMALLAAVTAVSTGMIADAPARARAQASRLAEELVRTFAHVELTAQLQGEVLGWSADDAGWQRWASVVPGAAPQWQPWLEAPPDLQLPAALSLALVRDNRHPVSGASQDQPDVVFVPAQGTAAFELLIRERSSGQALCRVWLAEDARLHWEDI